MWLFPVNPNVTTPILRGVNYSAPLLEPPSLLSQETPSRPDPVRRTGCNNELCRYCDALEKSLLWENFYVILINIYVLILFNCISWFYNELKVLFGGSRTSLDVTIYFILLMITIYKAIDWITPPKRESGTCSRLHFLWKKQNQLRQEQPSIHCLFLCSAAIGVWLFGHINSSYRDTIYWSILFAPPILQLPLGISEIITPYLTLHRDWTYNNNSDSDEDEFLPVVTEANLQILDHVGETGDHSAILSPNSSCNDSSSRIPPKEDSLNEEDLIEGLDIPSHDEGSTDGAELSELELSLGENDGNDLKFHTGHFNNSSSSSEEEIWDSKKIIPSESENSDFEIIDEQEIANIKM